MYRFFVCDSSDELSLPMVQCTSSLALFILFTIQSALPFPFNVISFCKKKKRELKKGTRKKEEEEKKDSREENNK